MANLQYFGMQTSPLIAVVFALLLRLVLHLMLVLF